LLFTNHPVLDLYLSMQETQVIEKPRTVTVDVELFLIWDEETKQYVSHIPVLDLSSYDDNPEEAKRLLLTLVPETLEYMHEQGTLIEWLLESGWTVTLKPEPKLLPPPPSQEYLNTKPFRVDLVSVGLPV
jgi:hypothetical protein